MKIKPDVVYWHTARDRVKTAWLLRGLFDAGIPVSKIDRLLKRYNPRSNRLGPYVYPIGVRFGEKIVVAMIDINTIPKTTFPVLENRTKCYFKTHATREVLRRPNVVLMPNSASRLEYLEHLPELRKIKNSMSYDLDFFFNGWHDDDGLRLWTVKAARSQKQWKVKAGCLPFKHHTTVPASLQIPRMPYYEYLKQHARSKIGLALPGGGALPFMSFRHVELMGIGCAVITRTPTSVPFGRGFSDCAIFYDKSNFVDRMNYYLRDDNERERIAAAARDYYDRYLTPAAHAKYFINTIIRREHIT